MESNTPPTSGRSSPTQTHRGRGRPMLPSTHRKAYRTVVTLSASLKAANAAKQKYKMRWLRLKLHHFDDRQSSSLKTPVSAPSSTSINSSPRTSAATPRSKTRSQLVNIRKVTPHIRKSLLFQNVVADHFASIRSRRSQKTCSVPRNILNKYRLGRLDSQFQLLQEVNSLVTRMHSTLLLRIWCLIFLRETTIQE